MATGLSLPATGRFCRGALLGLLGGLLLSGLRGTLLRVLLSGGLGGPLLRLLGRLLLSGLRGALLRLLLSGGLRGALLSLLRPLLASGGLCGRALLGLLSRCRFGSGS